MRAVLKAFGVMTRLDPFSEAHMGHGLGVPRPGDLRSLSSGTGQPDQPIKDGLIVVSWSSGLLARLVALEDGCQKCPQVDVDAPDGRVVLLDRRRGRGGKWKRNSASLPPSVIF